MDHITTRKDLKRKKPEFRRQDSHKKKRVSRTGYRRPKGLQSKVRLNKRGYVKKVTPGYGSPSDVKNMDPKGLFPFIVENKSQLDTLDSSREGAIIASSVGERKRIEIMQEALSKKITLLNVKDPEAYIKDIQDRLKEKKETRKHLKAEKKKKEESKKQEKVESTADLAKASKDAEQDSSNGATTEGSGAISDVAQNDEEKKKAEKAEKDKVLTKRD